MFFIPGNNQTQRMFDDHFSNLWFFYYETEIFARTQKSEYEKDEDRSGTSK
jgi:hypothetical protein